MGSLSSVTDPQALLVADASTVINLNATGCARRVLRAFPNRVAVLDVVCEELEEGRQQKRQDADLLRKLVEDRHIEIVQLDDEGEEYFEQLVIGAAEMTLDDGEAATIAYAVSHNGIAVIDERKANRLCAERFRELRMACTMDILTHAKVQHALGKESLADAVFNALYHGRMRVFPQHVEWVVGLIGSVRAALCSSLPSSVRVSTATAGRQNRRSE